MGSNVLVFAETSNAIHGDRRSRSPSARCMTRGDWASYGAPRDAGSPSTRCAEGVRLVYHHHMGTIVEIRAGYRRLHERRPARPRICCSTPATPPGAAPIRPRLARRYRARISHVHCKDVRKAVMEKAQRERLELPRCRCSPASTRCRATAWWISSRCSGNCRGYSGWVVIEAEQDPKKANPLTYAKMGYANLTRFLKEAGLR